MPKTPEYTKRAVNNYREKFDFIQVRFPKGTKEKLEEIGDKNSFIVNCVLNALNSTENDDTGRQIPTADNAPRAQIKPDLEHLYELYGKKINDIHTQLEIQEKYGNDVLLQLSDYAKKADQAEDNPGE